MPTRILLGLGLLGATLGSMAGPSAADCADWPLEDALVEAEVVFIGTDHDIERTRATTRSGEWAETTFDVEHVIRGDVPERVDVRMDWYAGAPAQDEQGRQLIFARWRDDVLEQEQCGPGASPEAALALGPELRQPTPVPDEPEAGSSSLVVVAVVGLAAAGLGFWWSFRTPRRKRT